VGEPKDARAVHTAGAGAHGPTAPQTMLVPTPPRASLLSAFSVASSMISLTIFFALRTASFDGPSM